MMVLKLIAYYLGKGIPDAVIFEAKRIFNNNIRSSKKHSSGISTEGRTEKATKVSQRLVSNKKVVYNEEEDYFITI